MSVTAIAIVENGKLKYRSDLIDHIGKFIREREGKRIIVEYSEDMLDSSKKNNLISYYRKEVVPFVFDLLSKTKAKITLLEEADFFLRYKFMSYSTHSEYAGDILASRAFSSLEEVDMLNTLSSIGIWTTRHFNTALPKLQTK